MDRLEKVRQEVDKIIEKIQDCETKKFAYIHSYGVSQACTLLARQRGANIELASIAGMLHDIAFYNENCPQATHAQKGAEFAKELLTSMELFTDEEIGIITAAIQTHSEKMKKDSGRLGELLKDADVMQHYLYNINIEVSPKDKYRLYYLLEQFDQAKKMQELWNS